MATVTKNVMQPCDSLRLKEAEVRIGLTKESSAKDVKIQELIREKYSLTQELAILRKIHIGKISDEEFKEYSDFIEECIKKVEDEEQEGA